MTVEIIGTVRFSGKSIYDFFKTVSGKYSSRFALNMCRSKAKGIRIALTEYSCVGKERLCIEAISEALIALEETSDREMLSSLLNESLQRLSQIQKSAEEEYRAKMMVSPKISLMIGLFVSVIVL